MCVCVWEGEGKRGEGSCGRWVGGWVGEYVLVCVCVVCVLIPSSVSLRIKMELNSFIRSSETLEDSGTCFDLFSNLEWVRTKGFFR